MLVFVVAVISLLIMKQEQAMLRISTDGHDQKIWGGGGLKFSLQGFFWVGNFGKYFVAGLF